MITYVCYQFGEFLKFIFMAVFPSRTDNLSIYTDIIMSYFLELVGIQLQTVIPLVASPVLPLGYQVVLMLLKIITLI